MKNLHKITFEELKKLQKIELELLLEVDRICRKCNIKYNIIAGTLLGAIRHKGFIPWDDDADVAMLRSEYKRFVNACKTELNTEKFYFQDHKETKGYRWGYGKLRRKDTLFLRNGQEHMPYKQGVFLDIFPVDNVPDSLFLRKIVNFKSFIIRKFLWSKVGRKIEKNSLKRFVYKIMDIVPEKTILGCYDRLIKSSEKINSKWVRNLMYPTANKLYGYKRRWYENSIELKFENHIIFAMKDYDEYLKFKFGDYMKLPPEKSRKVHPVSKLKLF